MRFGQSYCIDLLKTIPMKFSLHFSELYIIYYQFLKFKQISRNFKSEKNWKKEIEGIGLGRL
jgi:hypothetical protein